VWDLTGRILFNFEGHEAPIYSICPHHKENIQVEGLYDIFSISLFFGFCRSYNLVLVEPESAPCI